MVPAGAIWGAVIGLNIEVSGVGAFYHVLVSTVVGIAIGVFLEASIMRKRRNQ